MTKKNKIAIVGTVGVPGCYGGFETLAQNLVVYHFNSNSSSEIAVWCSSKQMDKNVDSFLSAKLYYIRLNANGAMSIFYDILSIFHALILGYDRILVLGVSGAICIPLFRIFFRAKFITNIDGIEWRREKWGLYSRLFLKFSEWLAVKFSHVVISDNAAIADYIHSKFNLTSSVIAYGGDHAVLQGAKDLSPFPFYLPESYCLGLCRIEPENNVHMILDAFRHSCRPIVFVGNWNGSDYGRNLRSKFSGIENITLLDPVYDPDLLYFLRSRANIYLHGHSAGGTNPSLVEMMHFGIPVVAFDCSYNRETTENKAFYFKLAQDILNIFETEEVLKFSLVGEAMKIIAERRYTWNKIGRQYFELLQ